MSSTTNRVQFVKKEYNKWQYMRSCISLRREDVEFRLTKGFCYFWPNVWF